MVIFCVGGRLIRLNVCPIAEFVSWTMGPRDKIEGFPSPPLSGVSTDRIPFIESIPLFDSTARCVVLRRWSALSAVFGKMEEPAASIRQKISSVSQGGPLLKVDDFIRIPFQCFHCETLYIPSIKCFDHTLSDKWSERRSHKCCKLDENT